MVSDFESWGFRPVLSVGAHLMHGVVYLFQYRHCFQCKRALKRDEPFFYDTQLQCAQCVKEQDWPQWSPAHHVTQSSERFRAQAEHVCAAMLFAFAGDVPNELLFGLLETMYCGIGNAADMEQKKEHLATRKRVIQNSQ
jgi:hypothetical protein